MKDVDDLAQFIRGIDGNHTMGAGALAEAIVSYQLEAMLAEDVIERAAQAIDPDVFFMSKTEWEAQNDHVEGDYENARLEALGTARAALTAALGIEGDER